MANAGRSVPLANQPPCCPAVYQVRHSGSSEGRLCPLRGRSAHRVTCSSKGRQLITVRPLYPFHIHVFVLRAILNPGTARAGGPRHSGAQAPPVLTVRHASSTFDTSTCSIWSWSLLDLQPMLCPSMHRAPGYMKFDNGHNSGSGRRQYKEIPCPVCSFTSLPSKHPTPVSSSGIWT